MEGTLGIKGHGKGRWEKGEGRKGRNGNGPD